jgi:hypothetical protein
MQELALSPSHGSMNSATGKLPIDKHEANIRDGGKPAHVVFKIDVQKPAVESVGAGGVTSAPLSTTLFPRLNILCPVALHTALNRFMSIFQIALILRAV